MRARSRALGHELRQLSPAPLRLRLRGCEGLAFRDLDDRDEEQVIPGRESCAEIDEGPLALRVVDDDDALHGAFSRMTGSTRSRSTAVQACARARERIRIT